MCSQENHRIISFGEVLWDMLPDGPVFGGAPLNFAYRISALGNEGMMISAVGKDELGIQALQAVRELGLSSRHIQVNDHYPTGQVKVKFDACKNPDYEIVRDVAYDHIAYSESLSELVSTADCICFGTLAQRHAVSRSTLWNLLNCFKGRFRFYDVNLRKDCYSSSCIRHSLEFADILKLNLQEAFELNSLLDLGKTDLEAICRKLMNEFHLEYCILTLEHHGSMTFQSARPAICVPGYRVSMVDPLGAGDGYSAGFVDAILRGRTLREASETGNKIGAVVATKKGATQAISPDDVARVTGNAKRSFFPGCQNKTENTNQTTRYEGSEKN